MSHSRLLCVYCRCMSTVDNMHDKLKLIEFCFVQDDIVRITRSNEPKIIQQYLEDYLILIQNRINQYAVELTTQSLSCPATLFTATITSLERIDQRLNEFVRLHHLDLTRQINYHVSKLRDSICEKQLVQQLSSYSITIEQVIITFRYQSTIIDHVCLFLFLLHIATCHQSVASVAPKTIGNLRRNDHVRSAHSVSTTLLT